MSLIAIRRMDLSIMAIVLDIEQYLAWIAAELGEVIFGRCDAI